MQLGGPTNSYAACTYRAVRGCPGRARLCSRVSPSSQSIVTTPHSGYHWDGSSRRFFEGWYFKVTIPENGQSFALIYSIEDPANLNSPVGGIGVQVMGPDDGYICQFNRNTDPFWASRHRLELGAVFKQRPTTAGRPLLRQPVPQAEFSAGVEQGFQASQFWHQGSILAAETGTPGPPLSSVDQCSWALSMTPKVGWGNAPTTAALTGPAAAIAGYQNGYSSKSSDAPSQKATAGWLSMLSVFEPHWQVQP
eukprot:GHRR01017030.1.p1 GENE.GHRR01017030.1~~GHRR01017030.1.p1  ORF type:complete len:251 (+),score=65.45 GHRR01017030.1:173-925(+)